MYVHSILSQEITKVIPGLLKDTGRAIFRVKGVLAGLGPQPTNAGDVRREFNYIVDVRLYCKSAGMGDLYLKSCETPGLQ